VLDQSSYWTRRTASRRVLLRGAAAIGGGSAALSFLAACGGGNTSTTSTGTSSTAPSAAGATAAAPAAALDPTKGKQGGKFIWQSYGDPGAGLELIKARNQGVHQMASLVIEGLLEFRNGTPAFKGTDIETQPSLAQAMPEQPDGQTYVFKLRPAKFHNGRTVTSEDVKYSIERYAGPESAWKNDMPWFDKVETPDPQTAVVKTKNIYADTLQTLAARDVCMILAREHQESPDAEKKFLGTGPYLFVEYNPPTLTRYKRNPEYHRQPYPYFDEIDRLGTSDPEKKVADFSSKQVHMTYWFPPEERDRIKKVRPDAQLWTYVPGGPQLVMRNDVAPYNDKRVRQALSMAIDRKALIQAVRSGEGEPDQWLTYGGEYWGFRKPKDLGESAKNFEFNVAEAKKLLTAAGVTLPLKVNDLLTWNATVIGQKHVDQIVLITTQWRNAGVVDAKLNEMTFGQLASTGSIGNYEAMQWQPNVTGTIPTMGIILRNNFWAPPEGIKGPPTLNLSYTNNPELSMLVEKQLTQLKKEERIQTLRRIEDILADEMYRIPGVPDVTNWFGDPSVKNMQTPREAYNGATPYLKYWWFEK
jgi:peptide/nickel transport system substrate-binding protein